MGDRATLGPFAYLRPGARIGAGAKIGTFVEVKNSDIGADAKVPHLSYIGDADVGEDSNIGAGNITANYDGQNKHRTTIGRGVKTGVDTSFVAPVSVGDEAYTGAGSVITEDVPEGALGIARSEAAERRGIRAAQEGREARMSTLETQDAPVADQPHHRRVRQAADDRRRPRQPGPRREDRRAAGTWGSPTPG